MFRVALLIVVFLSGPVAAQSTHGYPRLMQGPMMGPTSSTTARIWVRGSGHFEYQVEYATHEDLRDSMRSDAKVAKKADDYTLVFDLKDLRPDTTYHYRVLAEGNVGKYQIKKPPYRFSTHAAEPEPFRLAFGSCARFQAAHEQPIWGVLDGLDPDLFLWLGDNIYGDALDPDILAEEYRRQRETGGLVHLMTRVPQFAIWDDHDYALNNHDRTNPVKFEALRVFQRYWPNPAYGVGDVPGVFFRTSVHGVDLFFTDCRFHRDPNDDPDGPDKTMLGAKQFAWLLNELERSEAPFKFIICGSGFTGGKGPGGDSWSSYLHERDRLFAEIVERGIEGVVLLSGDTHAGELNRIESPHERGYPLFEIVSSPLAQEPNNKRRELPDPNETRLRQVYIQSPNVGILDIDPTGDDPVIRVNLANIYGEWTWEPFEIRASMLRIR